MLRYSPVCCLGSWAGFVLQREGQGVPCQLIGGNVQRLEPHFGRREGSTEMTPAGPSMDKLTYEGLRKHGSQYITAR